MSRKEIKYQVRYNSNPQLVSDNHTSDVLFLLDIDERNFDTVSEAIIFLNECTSPITTIEDLVPKLKKMRKGKNLEWILPENHIRPKHVLVADMENIFVTRDGRW